MINANNKNGSWDLDFQCKSLACKIDWLIVHKFKIDIIMGERLAIVLKTLISKVN